MTVTDKYLIIETLPSDVFVEESLRTLWVDQDAGIQQIMGKRTANDCVETHSFVFDKHKWTIEDARKWVKEHLESGRETQAEMLVAHRTTIKSKAILCASLPRLATGEKAKPLIMAKMDKKEAEAKLNDKYYFYTEGVHEGKNSNGDIFTTEELTANYKSAAYQQIDWEHIRGIIIGNSLESELIHKEEEPLALAFNGLLHRLSPYMQEEIVINDEFMTRDEIIKQRFFEDKLAVSMEVMFDSMKCEECGFETDSALEFDMHSWTQHRSIWEKGETVGRELIGIDFVGWGIVEMPADSDAYVNSLRTSDDGTLQDIVPASLKTKYGSMAWNVAFAQEVIKAEMSDKLIDYDNIIFASEKVTKKIVPAVQPVDMIINKVIAKIEEKAIKEKIIEKSSKKITKNKINNDNSIEEDQKNLLNVSKGGIIMFKLKDKISKGMTLNEAFVVAQKTLQDFQGDKTLDAEAKKAFVEELSEALASVFENEDFTVADIFTVTSTEKMKAIDAARADEQKTADEKIAELNSKITELETVNSDLTAKVAEANTKIVDLENAEAEKAKQEKVVAYINDEIIAAGITLSGIFEEEVKNMVAARIDDEEGLKKLKLELVAMVKQSSLEEGSKIMADASVSGGVPTDDLAAKFQALKDEVKEDN